jgi:hypothetical protein
LWSALRRLVSGLHFRLSQHNGGQGEKHRHLHLAELQK